MKLLSAGAETRRARDVQPNPRLQRQEQPQHLRLHQHVGSAEQAEGRAVDRRDCEPDDEPPLLRPDRHEAADAERGDEVRPAPHGRRLRLPLQQVGLAFFVSEIFVGMR